MKVILPEHIGEIKLYQFQAYSELLKRDIEDVEFNKRKICCFTDLKYHDLKNLRNKDFVGILEQIDIALNTEHKFTQRFELNGITFGFIPNLEAITQGEFVDLGLYKTDEVETYHKLMSILFRPIIKEDSFNNYEIEPYNGTEKYAETMKQIPLSYVNGAIVFFCDLGNDLLKSTQRYINQQQTKDKQQKTISKNGVGILH